jgi:hypothetical protein
MKVDKRLERLDTIKERLCPESGDRARCDTSFVDAVVKEFVRLCPDDATKQLILMSGPSASGVGTLLKIMKREKAFAPDEAMVVDSETAMGDISDSHPIAQAMINVVNELDGEHALIGEDGVQTFVGSVKDIPAEKRALLPGLLEFYESNFCDREGNSLKVGKNQKVVKQDDGKLYLYDLDPETGSVSKEVGRVYYSKHPEKQKAAGCQEQFYALMQYVAERIMLENELQGRGASFVADDHFHDRDVVQAIIDMANASDMETVGIFNTLDPDLIKGRARNRADRSGVATNDGILESTYLITMEHDFRGLDVKVLTDNGFLVPRVISVTNEERGCAILSQFAYRRAEMEAKACAVYEGGGLQAISRDAKALFTKRYACMAVEPSENILRVDFSELASAVKGQPRFGGAELTSLIDRCRCNLTTLMPLTLQMAWGDDFIKAVSKDLESTKVRSIMPSPASIKLDLSGIDARRVSRVIGGEGVVIPSFPNPEISAMLVSARNQGTVSHSAGLPSPRELIAGVSASSLASLPPFPPSRTAAAIAIGSYAARVTTDLVSQYFRSGSGGGHGRS